MPRAVFLQAVAYRYGLKVSGLEQIQVEAERQYKQQEADGFGDATGSDHGIGF